MRENMNIEITGIDNIINGLGNTLELLQSKEFKKALKSEVDKANKRLKRMNDFQKKIFESKGITQISRKGSLQDKIQALGQAKLVNESGISTKTEYNKYTKQLSKDLSLSIKEVDYMLNSFDSNTMDFISQSPLKYGTNPQVDFLYEDVIEVNGSIENKIDMIADYITDLLHFDNEITL